MVRNTRIRKRPFEIGVDCLKARSWWIADTKTRMGQFYDVTDESEANWLPMRRYIAHQVFVEGIE